MYIFNRDLLLPLLGNIYNSIRNDTLTGNRTFSANEQYFSLTTNQPTVLSAMAYQPNEQGYCRHGPTCA